jgi:uncharacterized membrane protein
MFWLPFLLFGVATQVIRTIVVKKVGHKINPVFATFGRFSFMPFWSGVFLLVYFYWCTVDQSKTIRFTYTVLQRVHYLHLGSIFTLNPLSKITLVYLWLFSKLV